MFDTFSMVNRTWVRVNRLSGPRRPTMLESLDCGNATPISTAAKLQPGKRGACGAELDSFWTGHWIKCSVPGIPLCCAPTASRVAPRRVHRAAESNARQLGVASPACPYPPTWASEWCRSVWDSGTRWTWTCIWGIHSVWLESCHTPTTS